MAIDCEFAVIKQLSERPSTVGELTKLTGWCDTHIYARTARFREVGIIVRVEGERGKFKLGIPFKEITIIDFLACCVDLRPIERLFGLNCKFTYLYELEGGL